jgi:hypothetical protein
MIKSLTLPLEYGMPGSLVKYDILGKDNFLIAMPRFHVYALDIFDCKDFFYSLHSKKAAQPFLDTYIYILTNVYVHLYLKKAEQFF